MIEITDRDNGPESIDLSIKNTDRKLSVGVFPKLANSFAHATPSTCCTKSNNKSYFGITFRITRIFASFYRGVKQFYRLPYNIVHGIVRYTYNFFVSNKIY